MNNYFLLFSNCLPVAGKKGSIICDVQNSVYWPIPLQLYEILTLNNSHKYTVEQLKNNYKNEFDTGIDAFFDYLIEKNLGTYADDISTFPDLCDEWSFPGKISNSILEIGSKTDIETFASAINQLSFLGCFALEIRIDIAMEMNDLDAFLSRISKSSIRYILILLRYNNGLDEERLISILEKHPRCGNIVVYDSPSIKQNGRLSFSNQNLDKRACGVVHKLSFLLNIKSFTESLHHNSCLNRKISIDVDGNIKNCPSMPQSFGNIKDTMLQEALDHPGFKKYWNVTKDQIAVCKDCEFRYICTDCRAYTENPQDMYAKPLKCGYNPYTCEWEEWSTNPLKQQAIDYYGMREVLPEFKLKPDYVPLYATSPE